MEKIYEYITTINPDIFLAVILTLLFSVEQIFFSTKSFLKRSPHLIGNIFLQIGYIIMNFVLATFVIKVLDWAANEHIGLFNWISVPFYLQVIAGVVCIDLVNYWAHRLNHTWALLWRFHRVHHSDTTMDSSTTYRFHPLEALGDNLAAIVAAFMFGLDGTVLVFWLIVYMPLLVLHHTDVIMPKWFEKTFGRVIVSPNLHKIHHHQQQVFTDSNYGLIFIFWDKLFNTYKELPVEEIKYGLEEFDNPERQTFWYLLKSPFINVKK